MFVILVVEDDHNTRRLMQAVLKANGYTVLTGADGVEAMEILDREQVDLILLDLMMPRMDGYAFTRQLRDAGFQTPILMVTAKQLPEDRKQGYRVGTDDFMTKPVDEEEMLLRIKSLLRRANIASERRLRLGDTVLDYDTLCVERPGESITLPQKEFQLLFRLLSSPGVIFTRQQLLDDIWGYTNDSTEATVTVHVHRLRSRFEGWADFDIATVRGLGYKAVRKEAR